MDDRAVSNVFSYTLSLAIAAVLVSGLLIAGGTFVEDQRTSVVRSELEVVGQRLAADVAAADRLVRLSDGDSSVRLTSEVPDAVAGTGYRVDVGTSGGNTTVFLSSTALEERVAVPVANVTAVAPGSVQGGDVVVAYDEATDRLEVTNA